MNIPEREVAPDEAAIAGIVTDLDVTPVQGAVVSLGGASPEHRDIGAVTDKEGRYRFDRLNPGLYTVLVNVEDYPQQTQEVRAKAGRLTHLDFTLRR